MTFGEKLRAARIKKNLTTEQVAQALEVSRVAVGHWEADTNMPAPKKIPELARLLDITPNHLFGFDVCEPEGQYVVPTTPRAKILDELLKSIPDKEADEIVRNLEDKKRCYDALVEEILKKRTA